MEPVYLHGRIAEFVGGICLKIQTLYLIHIRYELSKFVCDWLIIKVTLCVQQRTFTPATWFPLEGFF